MVSTRSMRLRQAQHSIDPLVLPPVTMLERMGLTPADVGAFESLHSLQDVLFFELAEFCRREIVGLNGTTHQLLRTVEGRDMLVFGQAALFLVKNRIRPLASDVCTMSDLSMEAARRVSRGDIHAVNRRHALVNAGGLTDGILLVNVRARLVGVAAA